MEEEPKIGNTFIASHIGNVEVEKSSHAYIYMPSSKALVGGEEEYTKPMDVDFD